jgi:hypothetical protein
MGGGTGPALINDSYLEELQGWGGRPPYTWSISEGSLPTGLDLDTATGKISGTPTETGSWTFTVRLTDSTTPTPEYVEKQFTIHVVELKVTPGPANPLSAFIPTLSQDTVMMQFKLSTAIGISAAEVTSITFTASGSGDDSTDVENVRLFTDNNHDGKLDAGDTQLGTSQTYSANNGTVTFTDFDPSFSIDQAEIVYLILVYDFTKNAWPEEEFQVRIASISDVVVAGLTLAGPPVQGAMQSIRYPNWVQRNPSIRDSGGSTVILFSRTDHDWAYDSVRKVFVMFSGVPVAVQNETWEYDGATQVWLRVGTDPDPLDPPPCTRQNHAMCFIKKDPAHTFMFGGRVAWSTRTYVLDDSCRYVDGEWGGIMGYETAHNHDWYPSHWEFFHPADAIDPASTCPQRREYHAIEYHEAAGVAVMYGGLRWLSYPPDLPDTWTTAGDPNMPTEIDSNQAVQEYSAIWNRLYANSAPGGRHSHAMVYDSTNERIIMFGGYRSTASPYLLNDTWELTSSLAWNNLSPVHSPPARENHDMMYDPDREVMILFGGATDRGSMFNDTWEFAQTEKESNYDWIQMKSNNSPSARSGHVMGWDPDREIPRSTYDTLYKIPNNVGGVQKGVGVLFGGYNKNDTWEYLR